jgi:P27 family predicted phage terminase small subunit
MRNFIIDLEKIHPKAKAQMDEIIKFLTKDKSIIKQDSTALVILSNSFSVYYQAIDILNRDGLVFEDENKVMEPCLPGMEPTFITRLRNIKPHPALKIANDSQNQITKLLIEFGLTPRSRKKTTLIPKKIDALSPADIFVGKINNGA